MTNSGGDSLFDDFLQTFDRWKNLPRPIGSLKDIQAPTYPTELDLDHVVSELLGVGNEAAERSTKIDWPRIIPEYLADLDAIEKTLDAVPIPEEQKRKYRNYISECRSVWEKMRSLPVPSEGHLGFRKQALSSFRFLEDTYGFRVVESTPITVRYESSRLLVELEYSPECPELSFSLGELAQTEDSPHLFSLDDFLYWAGLGSLFDYNRFNFQSRNGLADFVAFMAQMIQAHAGPVLRNETGALNVLAEKQAERERAIAKQLNGQRS